MQEDCQDAAHLARPRSLLPGRPQHGRPEDPEFYDCPASLGACLASFIAWITANLTSGDASWCSLSLLEDLVVKSPNEGTFSMTTHRSLRYVIRRAPGSARGARGQIPAGTARARVTRGVLVPALVLAGLGLAAAASPGHGISGLHWSAHQQAGIRALWVRADSQGSCRISGAPRMAVTANKMPWMYAKTSKMPWMYAVTNRMPWMYAATNKMPWTYATPVARHKCAVVDRAAVNLG